MDNQILDDFDQLVGSLLRAFKRPGQEVKKDSLYEKVPSSFKDFEVSFLMHSVNFVVMLNILGTSVAKPGAVTKVVPGRYLYSI